MNPKYYAEYISSSGQPANGYATYTNKRDAIRAARRYRHTHLLERSGGKARAGRIDASGMDGDIIWEWYESAGGGYVTAC